LGKLEYEAVGYDNAYKKQYTDQDQPH